MKINKKTKKLSKKLLFGILSLLLMGGLAVGFYMFEYGSTTSYAVAGIEGNLSVVIELQNVEWDASSNLNHSQDLVLMNYNGDTSMLINFDIAENVIAQNCNGEGDITYELYKGSEQLYDGGYVNISNGQNVLSLNASAVNHRVCERFDLITLNLTEVGL